MTPSPSGIEKQVCEDIAKRQALGLIKYGVSVADSQIGLKDWLQHAYLESLDKCIYLKRAISEIGQTQCACSSTHCTVPEPEPEEANTKPKENSEKEKQDTGIRGSRKVFVKPIQQEVVQYFQGLTLPDFEASRFFDYYETNGWRVGRFVMKDWRAAARNWQRTIISRTKTSQSGADKIIFQKEYDRILERMTILRSTYGDCQTWDPKDREELKKLRIRRDELRTILGILL